MGLLKRFAQGGLQLNRIEAFSDGVFAIVVTLIVLELRCPVLHDRGSVGELCHQLVDLVPKFLSWLISFIIVCFFFSSKSRHTRWNCDWSSDVCSSDLAGFDVRREGP